MRAILPHNPCTIAGVTSLLAGSSICAPRRKVTPTHQTGLPLEQVASEGKTTRPMQYVLGWWDDGKSRRFGIDVSARRRGQDKHSSSSSLPSSAGVSIESLFTLWGWHGGGGNGPEKGAQVQLSSTGRESWLCRTVTYWLVRSVANFCRN